MTIWTLHQIDQAESARANVRLSREHALDAYPEARREARLALFSRLKATLHTFAIEIDEADARYRQQEVDGGFDLEVRWEPRTTEVELRGGEHDGDVLDFVDAPGQPLRVVTNNESGDDVYVLAGWSEIARRWIYSV